MLLLQLLQDLQKYIKWSRKKLLKQHLLFKNITKALLIVELMQKGETFDDAYLKAEVDVRDKTEVIKIVNQLVEILDNYDVSE